MTDPGRSGGEGTGWTQATLPGVGWVDTCETCGAIFLNRRLHDEFHQNLAALASQERGDG